MEEALKLFMMENPMVEPELAYDIILFNWQRGVRDLEDLTCIEEYANTYSDAD